MKRILSVLTVLQFAYATAQEGMPEPEPVDLASPLLERISSMAEAETVPASEYYSLAQETVNYGMSQMQQGQPVPEPPLKDALDAVSAGRSIDPDAADWDAVEKQLLDMLNPPPEQQQQQQESDPNSDQQDGEESQEGEQGESGDQEGEEGEQSEESNDQQGQQQDGENQSQEGDQQEQESDSQDSEGEGQQDQGDPSGEQGQEGEENQMPKAQDGAQMGELEQPETPQDIELDGESQETPPPTPEQMQTLGGQRQSGEPVDAEKAALMQMLEQLKQQDEPGKLYKILQEAQTGGQQKSQPNTKDW